MLAPVLKLLHMSCNHYSDLTLQSMDRPLDFGEKLRLRLHYLACSMCRDFQKQMNALSALVKSTFASQEPAKPAPAFLETVRGKLTEIADEEGNSGGTD